LTKLRHVHWKNDFRDVRDLLIKIRDGTGVSRTIGLSLRQHGFIGHHPDSDAIVLLAKGRKFIETANKLEIASLLKLNKRS